MDDFTPFSALAGGALIGLAASLQSFVAAMAAGTLLGGRLFERGSKS